MRFRYLIIILLLFVCYSLSGQTSSNVFSDSAIYVRLWNDINMLASDSFKGREAGTEGEIMARDYIHSRFKEIGLAPAFDNNSYLQNFKFESWGSYDESTQLTINNKSFKIGKDFYPLSYTANDSVFGKIVNVGHGIIAPENDHNDYKNLSKIKGKIFIIEMSIPGGFINSEFANYIKPEIRIETAIKKGAKAIIFVNSDPYFIKPFRKPMPRVKQYSIPVIFADKRMRAFIRRKKSAKAQLKVNIKQKINSCYNVAGLINNNSNQTIIIGAHYDHLGMGAELSRYKGPPAIHNGADDNASGVAAVMELAKYLKVSDFDDVNFLFIAFSAEEKGFKGSRHFMSGDEYSNSNVKYYINIDMIGRLDTARGLSISGLNTSPVLDTLVTRVNSGKFDIHTSDFGLWASDLASFYRQKIPGLFFFTGIHPDYHKPSDDIDKINFEGEIKIINFIEDVIKNLENIKSIPFSKVIVQ